jgi:iron complex outermembrane receptor protein
MVKPGFQVDNPADLHEVRASTIAEGRNLQYGTAGRFTMYLAPAIRLTSLSAFRTLDYDRVVDTDITELELNATDIHEIQHQISEELTLSQRHPRFTWVGGLFWFDETDRQPTFIRMQGAARKNLLNPRVEATSTAAFAQTTIGVSPALSVTAGLRHTRERKRIDNAGQILTLDRPRVLVPGSAYEYSDAVAHNPWTPRFGLESRMRENAFAYFSVTRGFKSGGFNLTSTERGRGIAPESAWSYEGGVKTDLSGGRAKLNVSAFRTLYTDLQVSAGIRPGVIDIANAAAATIRGVEVEATARFVDAMQAGGHLVWLDARYDRYIATGVGGVTSNVAGQRLTNSPEWSARLWLEWTRGVGAASSLSLRGDANWQTTVFFTPSNDIVQRQRPYAVVNASAVVGPRHGRWSVEGYARNLTNEDYITGTFGTPAPAIGGRPGDPRQLGVRFVVRS